MVMHVLNSQIVWKCIFQHCRLFGYVYISKPMKVLMQTSINDPNELYEDAHVPTGPSMFIIVRTLLKGA